MQGSLDLSELLHLFVRKLWLIVLVSVVGVLAAFGVTKLMLTPQYTSSVQLYVSSSQSEQPITLNDINTAQKLVNTYTVIVQSDTVLEKVIAAFQQQLDSLFENDVVDITAEIRVMEKMMASEGLAGTNDFK